MNSANSSASPTEIDFITALGRLLRDGQLRDAFAANPAAVTQRLKLRPADRPEFLKLVPVDLEFQARTLLRKRFDLIRHFLPETLKRLEGGGWPAFRQYARTCWPPDSAPDLHDAFQFCELLSESSLADQPEHNRLHFILSSQRLKIHGYWRVSNQGKFRPTLQILFRTRPTFWREVRLRLGL